MRDQLNYNKILEVISDGVILVDEACHILLMNKAARNILGVQSEYLHLSISQFMPNSRLPLVMANKASESNHYETTAGNRILVTSNYTLFDERNHISGGITIMKDVTSEDSIPQEAEYYGSLKEAKVIMNQLMCNTHDAVSITDENGNLAMVNEAYCRLFQKKYEELVGKPCFLHVGKKNSMHMKVLESKVQHSNLPVDLPDQCKHLVVNVTPIIVGNQFRGSLSMAKDMTKETELTGEIMEKQREISRLQCQYDFSDLIGRHPRFVKAVEEARRIADTLATVLILGEYGTEKDTMAQAIHNASTRSGKTFAHLRWGCDYQQSIIRMLRGYESLGDEVYPSIFEQAEGGTIYLENINRANREEQEAILRVLERKEIVRIGKEEPVHVNVRVIASSAVNLENLFNKGIFDENLYYCLNFFVINIPPLRDRNADIKLLSETFIKRLNYTHGKHLKGITPLALVAMTELPWRGNILELANYLDQAIMNADIYDNLIDVKHLPVDGRIKKGLEADTSEELTQSLNEYMEKMEKNYILAVLHKNKGNKSKTARNLDISLRNLYYKLEKYDIIKF